MFYFGTNFKMHQTPDVTRHFVRILQDTLGSPGDTQLFLIPPFTSLPGLPELAHATNIWIGAQNVHPQPEGAYTGEISAPMLAALNLDLVMVGHAERRQLFGETDVLLHDKVAAVVSNGMRLLLCVGEDADEKRFGVERETVARQLKIALHSYPAEAVKRLMIAYEPVWAIGEGSRAASVDDVLFTVEQIHDTVEMLFGARVPVLYGGSVNAENCADYAALDLIDGLFVGRAVREPEGFVKVYRAAMQTYDG